MTIPSFSAETLRKAHALRALNLIERDPDQPHVWWVRSVRLEQHQQYRVQEDVHRDRDGHLSCTWVTCSCPHGANSGGQPRCYHVAAVLMKYLDDAARTTRMSGAEFIAAYAPTVTRTP